MQPRHPLALLHRHATAAVRAPPRRQAVRSCVHRRPALPPLGAHTPPHGCLCTASRPPSARTATSRQTTQPRVRVTLQLPLPAHTSAAACPCMHLPWQPRPVMPCADTTRAGPFCPLLAVLKPNKIIRKRTDVYCNNFHLRVFLGLSNPHGQRQTSTLSIPHDNFG
jgi:hypothetical protein